MSRRLAAVFLATALALPAVAAAQNPPNSAATPGVDRRQVNQEQRIDRGVASGELTRPETRRLEQGQNKVERIETRAKSDGAVTRRERARLHHAQDVQSQRIWRQKHDRQDRPRAN